MNERLDVRNPRTGQIDYWITPPTRDQLADVCARLRQGQISWRQLGLARRIEIVQQWKEVVLSHRDELLTALTTDTGRRTESMREIDVVGSTIDRWSRVAPEVLSAGDERATTIPFIRVRRQFVPYSLVGVISPWNVPLALALIDAVPALLAGCAVVVKPSEVTPRFIRPLVETIESVPELREALTFVEGGGETGAALIEFIDLVCFTGGVKTGRQVAEAAARAFIPAFLELGGKDPAVVLASANIELATSAILWGAVNNVGQNCLSIERIYVADSIFDQFVEKLIDKVQRIRLAYPSLEDGQLGPIIAERQAVIIEEHLRDATRKGAVIHCGGSVENLGGGLWCRPTVLTRVNHSMKVMTEETFGPLMPVMPFSTVEEAIHLANDTIYGLSAAVFASSEDEARAVAGQLDAGGISINDAALTAVLHEAEKNSFKASGLGGSRMGPSAIKRFVRQKAFLIKTESVVDPWWFEVLTIKR
jgi:acyl-CoA reductase-like NAD-dependent aldehyde dehydrogenase